MSLGESGGKLGVARIGKLRLDEHLVADDHVADLPGRMIGRRRRAGEQVGVGEVTEIHLQHVPRPLESRLDRFLTIHQTGPFVEVRERLPADNVLRYTTGPSAIPVLIADPFEWR